MTIKELIEKLQQYNPNTEIFLRDADTDWKMPIHLRFDNEGRGVKPGEGFGAVALYGDYSETDSAF